MNCEICGKKDIGTFRGLSLHVANKHKMVIKDYYDLYLKKEGDGICVECGESTTFRSMTNGYFKYCSSKCSNISIETKNKRNQTCKSKYGKDNYNNSKQSSLTWQNKSEEEIKEIVSKRRKTKKEKYGSEDYTNREKSVQTCLERYGVEHFTNREKAIQTCLERYGVENTFCLSEVRDKIKEYFMDNFNVTHPAQVEEIKNRIVQGVNEFYTKKIQETLKEYFDIIEYKDENNIHVKCKNCGNDYWRQKQHFIWRINKNIHPCYKCCDLSQTSVSEKELLDFIKQYFQGDIITNTRKIIHPYELDIYLPELKLAFEFNGVYWHSEKFVDKDYHLRKTELCEKQGIHLIHIYEDDWNYKQKIVHSIILNLLGKSQKIDVENTDIKEVSFKDSQKFLEENHIQGGCISKINLGLYYNDELVSLMTFSLTRKFMGGQSKLDSYELLRYCSRLGLVVVGGCVRLYRYFVNGYDPGLVVSYVDRSWTMDSGDTMYDRLGFERVGETRIGYHYIEDGIRRNRFNFRKDVLVSQGFDSSKSEREIMFEREMYRIYNSGNLKYVWSRMN